MEVKSKVQGKIVEISVKEGDSVSRGDKVGVMEAMKMESPIPAPQDGTIKEIKLQAGDRISPGSVIMIIE